MTSEKTSANDEVLPSYPVSQSENEEVRGLALCCDSAFEDEMKLVDNLRSRQKAYRASLPTDPDEIITAALAAMYPGGGDYPDGFEEALHLSHALVVMVEDGIDDAGSNRDAAVYIADRVIECLRNLGRSLDQVGDLLSNRKRAGVLRR